MQTKDQTKDYEEGQFDDAEEDATAPAAPNNNSLATSTAVDEHRQTAVLIDEVQLLEWSDPEGEEEVDEDDLREEDFEDIRIEDEDWEIAERDFTKQYNRLRQHVAVHSGTARGTLQSNTRSAGPSQVAALPAVNWPRAARATSGSNNAAERGAVITRTTDQLAALSKYASRLAHINDPYDQGAQAGAGLGVSVNRKGPSAHANLKDKSDRATSEQVLDPRTRLILYKMIGRGLLLEVNGCVSTGKEANVYHALSPTREHLALKIYKTSILIFKDRDRYVTGEHRFRRGYARHNPRKMVRVWAEKEMRNLRRLVAAGVPCPEPVEVRENVLVMQFLGDKDGWPSPRLKDADIPSSELRTLYHTLLLTIRMLFHNCKLVHADLSEYNLLYHNATIYVIDVSQSVEHDHPHAFDFLRSDVKIVEEFFSRRDVRTLGLRKAFEFVTRERFEEAEGADDAAVLERWLETAATEPELDATPADDATAGDIPHASDTAARTEHEDAVFMRSYIPRTLNEVIDPERDVDAVRRGEGKNLIYADTIGLVSSGIADDADGEKVAKPRGSVRFAGPPASDGDGSAESGSDSDASDSDAEGEGTGGARERKLRGHRHEDRDARRERKAAVKEEAREKRKHKMKKAEKKKKIKNSRH